MTAPLLGIDLNGLCDVSVTDVKTGVLRGGSVPSVLVVQPRQKIGDPLRVIAGTEAAMAIEGRGWQWPNSAHVTDTRQCLRVPLQRILEALGDGHPIEAAGETLNLTDLLAAAIAALARPQGPATDAERRAVIAVPDDGRFLEEARQRLIDAAVQGGLTPTLLWRPVAALLGMEPALRADQIARLSGKTVGVLSCLEDGVHAARLEVEVETDMDGPYFVPVRRKAGIVAPYRKPISALAAELAVQYAPDDDPQEGWQILWGNGLVLSWMLHLEAKDAIVQTGSDWRLIRGQTPEDLPQIEFDDTALDDLASFLEGVDYNIIEGPALETIAYGTRLAYFLRDRVVRTAVTLKFATKNAHLAARGCAVYQQRKDRCRVPYYDHLPQLRLAVRRGTDPEFLDLIDPNARIEGGMPYDEECNLGLSVQPGTSALNFYLLREGNSKPRHIQVKLPERLTTTVPIRMRIRQLPAQGTARLTLVGAGNDGSFRPVELRWEDMTEHDLSEKEVLNRLRDEPLDVPPVQPQPCHALLWTAQLADTDGSLVQFLPQLATALHIDPPSSEDLAPLLAQHSRLLTRRASPARLTRQGVRDWSLYRAVSSEGDVPEPSDGLSSGSLEQFDNCLKILDQLITSELSNQIVRFGGWCFLRCPDGIRRHLIDTAKSGRVPDFRIYYRAMGKVFTNDEECRVFFSLLAKQLTQHGAVFKLHQIEGLFYLLSLRETAPLVLTDRQATLFASKLLARIQECVRGVRTLSRLVSASLKAYAGLMRYRLVRPDYMTSQDPTLGEEQHQILANLLQRSNRDQRVQIATLTANLIEWSEKRGTDRNILQWDPDDG